MNGNGKGPQDKGPQSGRKLGYCTGNNRPGRENREENLEFGLRRGNGCKHRGSNGQTGGQGRGRGCKRGRRD